jgi:hypothetical protein
LKQQKGERAMQSDETVLIVEEFELVERTTET